MFTFSLHPQQLDLHDLEKSFFGNSDRSFCLFAANLLCRWFYFCTVSNLFVSILLRQCLGRQNACLHSETRLFHVVSVFSYVDLMALCHAILYLAELCRSYLYGAVLDKPKQSVAVAAQGKPGKAAAGAAGAVTQQASSKARVVRTETSASVLSDLVARWRAFKDDVQQVRV